jgi:alpha-tubulin suppressor-like RCC1 family protein
VLPGHIGPAPRAPATLPPNAGPPPFLSNVVSVGAGASYSCALRVDGAAFCWGNNSSGQRGDGTVNSSAIPVAVTGGHVFAQLFVSDVAACALTALGEAYCWGWNFLGQLGTGEPIGTIATVPTPVAGNLRFRTLGVGLVNACGIATDGAVWCWGRNNHRQLASAVPLNDVSTVPVAIPGTAPLGLVSIDAGNWAVCGLDASGALYCWGSKGDVGNGPGTEDLLIPTRSGTGTHSARCPWAASIRVACRLTDRRSAGDSGTSWETGTARPA